MRHVKEAEQREQEWAQLERRKAERERYIKRREIKTQESNHKLKKELEFLERILHHVATGEVSRASESPKINKNASRLNGPFLLTACLLKIAARRLRPDLCLQ